MTRGCIEMAAEVILPENLQIIGGIFGAALATGAIVVGWARAKTVTPTTTTELAGGIVDARSVKVLVEAIEDGVNDLTKSRRDEIAARNEMGHQLERLREELENLISVLGKIVRAQQDR